VTPVSYTVEGWGVGELWFEEGRLVWHELPTPRRPAESSPGTRARARTNPTQGGGSSPPPSRSTLQAKRTRSRNGSAPEAQELIHRLEAYFTGRPVSFADVEIDADGWTPFQTDVLGALRGVGYGEIVSYSDLARLAGHPRAQRAAGSFCAHNRFPLIVPCHRVVSTGGIGSYGSLGLDYKRRLLALEGVTL
jgi:methylated-DNA-[protein]-cysteine S-methyltransferase